MVSSLSWDGLLQPSVRMKPRQVTAVCDIWAFSWTTSILYWLGSSEASLVGLAIRMSSAYWRRVSFSRGRTFRSLAKLSPKMGWEFLHPWGQTARKYCFSCMLSPATHKPKFLVTLGLMEYKRRHHWRLIQNTMSWWLVEWPAGCRN